MPPRSLSNTDWSMSSSLTISNSADGPKSASPRSSHPIDLKSRYTLTLCYVVAAVQTLFGRFCQEAHSVIFMASIGLPDLPSRASPDLPRNSLPCGFTSWLWWPDTGHRITFWAVLQVSFEIMTGARMAKKKWRVMQDSLRLWNRFEILRWHRRLPDSSHL